jgi:uncharacterized glyoxalase superfamily protein PhnB
MPEIPQDVQNRAGAIQAAFNAEVTATRSNGDLTPDAKLRRLARAWTDAEVKMGELRQSWQGSAEQSAESLTKQIFGSTNTAGADAISVRDADDRASRLEDAGEALALLQRADDNGDAVLARAIAQHAFGKRNEFFGGDWGGVVDAYAQTHPHVAEKITTLASLRTDTVKTGIASAITFSIFKPAELEQIRWSQMEKLLKSGG